MADKPTSVEPNFVTMENLNKRIYVLHYKARYRPSSINFVADGIKDANERGLVYCKRYGLKFISVCHFFADLQAAPADSREGYEIGRDAENSTGQS